jgi:hypothetical protein
VGAAQRPQFVSGLLALAASLLVAVDFSDDPRN